MIRRIVAALFLALAFAWPMSSARAACDYDVGGSSPFLMTTFEAQLDEELGCIGTILGGLDVGSDVQAFDADLTMLAAGVWTDPNADRLAFWDDSDGRMEFMALADMTAEPAPAAGDYIVLYGAEGDVRKVNWNSLPGIGGGISNIVEDTTPQLGGTLDTNGNAIEFGTAATDTSVVRSSAGHISVEGKVVYQAGDTDVALADGGTGASLSDPNADRIAFWDDSAGSVDWLTLGSNLSITGMTINATGGGGATPDVQTMTATGSGDSWDKPAGGQTQCKVELWGGGGGGGKGQSGQAGAGGGGGQYITRDFLMSALSSTEQVTVATGGASQTTADTNGNVGGNTTFGSAGTLVTAYGGGPGEGTNIVPNKGGAGGGPFAAGGNTVLKDSATAEVNLLVANVQLNWGLSIDPIGSTNPATTPTTGYFSAAGGSASADATNTNAAGGKSWWGGAGGGAGAEDAAPGPGTGGTSQFGGGGGAGAFDANNATDGSQPGGGGGGSETGNSGGGGNGKAVITCW